VLRESWRGFLIYYCVGLIWDATITFEILAVGRGWATVVAVTTFFLTVLAYEAYNKLVGEGMKRLEIYSLALGSATGAYLAVKFIW